MKKILFYLLLCCIVFMFESCTNKKVETKNLKLAMVSNLAAIDDRSFNQNTWEGILKYANEFNLPKENYSFINSPTPEYYITNLSNFADKHLDLIIAPGYCFYDAMNKVAPKYPHQKFLIIDNVSEVSNNVLSVTFASNEGSFLVGVCAALKAKDMGWKKVGFLGGVDGFLVQEFEAGYVAGVKTVDPSIEVVVRYSDDFVNPMKGQKIASKMFDNNVNIIFNVAGSTGNGLIKEAKRRTSNGDKVWVIGVDKDQYEDGIYNENNSSVILTSMTKRLDIATYDTIVSVDNGTFKGGTKKYTLKNNGVGLPKKNPNLDPKWLRIAQQYKRDIIKGDIIVPSVPERIKNLK